MDDRESGFLSRWSRLKSEEREQKPAAIAAEDAPSAPDAETEPGIEATDPNADLPPIETLGRHSDYTVFMRAGVAPALRNQALRKLWRSDPVFANLDGLLEYGGDYSLPFKNRDLVVTAYQVGKGMVESALGDSTPADAVPAPELAPESPASASPEQPAVDTAGAKTETEVVPGVDVPRNGKTGPDTA